MLNSTSSNLPRSCLRATSSARISCDPIDLACTCWNHPIRSSWASPHASLRSVFPAPSRASRRFDPGRLWAYARRETMELLRDPIRLSFAFVGPVILMLAFGYGITFDVENLKFAAFDQDETPESHRLIENFS